MEESTLRSAADALLEAYDARIPIGPLRGSVPAFDVAAAYRVQQFQAAVWHERGRRLIGHKIGLTSRAMQEQLGVDSPDYGLLYADMVEDEHAPIDMARYLQPRIEPEIAVVLGRRLKGPGLTVEDCRRAVEAFVPSLEIIDSRIRDWDITLADTVADNASSGGLVLGVPATSGITDVRWVGCTLLRNGRVAATGTGAAVMDDPMRAVAWLANTVGAHGVELEEGQVILTGSCTVSIPVAPGDCFTANLGALGTVSAVFAGT